MKENDIKVPKEIRGLITELEAVKTFEDGPELYSTTEEDEEPYEFTGRQQRQAEFNSKKLLLNTILRRINRSKD